MSSVKVMKKHKRSKLFVDPKLQIAVICRVTLYWLVSVAVLALLAAVQVVLSSNAVGYEVLVGRVLTAFGPALIASVIVLPLLLFDSVRFSNKFAGPMFRLRTEMQNLAETGQGTPLKFREGDFWYDLANSYNAIAERMNTGGAAENDELSTESANSHKAVPVA